MLAEINPIQLFEKIGMFDIFAPFLMIYAMVFGVLEIGQIFKRDPKDPVGRRLHAVFALVYALYVVRNTDVVLWIQKSVPEYSLLLLAAVGFLMLAGILVGGEVSVTDKWMKGLVAVIILVVVYYLYLSKMFGLGLSVSGTPISFTEEDIGLFIMIAIIGIGVYYLVSGSGNENGSSY